MDIKKIILKKQTVMEKLEKLENMKSEISEIVFNKIKRDYLDELETIEDEIKNNSEGVLEELEQIDGEIEELNRIISEFNTEMEEILVRFKLGEFEEESFKNKKEDIEKKINDYNIRLEELNGKKGELGKFLSVEKVENISSEEVLEHSSTQNDDFIEKEAEKVIEGIDSENQEINPDFGTGNPDENKDLDAPIDENAANELDDILQPSSLENIQIGGQVEKIDEDALNGIETNINKIEELFETNMSEDENENNNEEEIEGLKCPKCNHINKPDLFNCEKCGAELL